GAGGSALELETGHRLAPLCAGTPTVCTLAYLVSTALRNVVFGGDGDGLLDGGQLVQGDEGQCASADGDGDRLIRLRGGHGVVAQHTVGVLGEGGRGGLGRGAIGLVGRRRGCALSGGVDGDAACMSPDADLDDQEDDHEDGRDHDDRLGG